MVELRRVIVDVVASFVGLTVGFKHLRVYNQLDCLLQSFDFDSFAKAFAVDNSGFVCQNLSIEQVAVKYY